MANEKAEVIFTPGQWTAEVDEELLMSGALGTADEAEEIAASVASGQAALYQVSGSANGWIVLRGEQIGQKSELVIVALCGQGAVQIGRYLEKTAKALGYESLRFHTSNRKMKALAKRLGYVERERVYGRQIK